MNTEEFIKKAKQIHGDKYDYSKVVYKKSKEKVCIICPKHGEFWQTPNMHLKGQGCKCCYYERVSKRCKKTTENFVNEMTEKYGDLYDFSKVNYKTNKDKVIVICKKHGEFEIRPNDLISGYKCPKCAYEKNSKYFSKGTENFIEQSLTVHNRKYDYSKVEYVNNHTKVCIICPKHGEFWQLPRHHINGHGCPYCNESKLEKEVEKILVKNNIEYKRIYREVLNKNQSLDFYLPKYRIAIECQGIQHFEPVDFSSKGKDEEYFKIVSERDLRKNKICDEKHIPIIYFHKFKKYYGTYGIEAHNEKELLNFISNYE